MTLDDLRRATELLPSGSSLTLMRDALLEALTTNATAAEQPVAPADEEMLTVTQAAARLNVSTRWCYDHGKELGVRKLSRRCVRFSARAVDRYLSRRPTR